MKKGIAVAGTILVDKLNEISAYPNVGELTKITRVGKSVGGCVPNVSVDLKKICPALPVKAFGRIARTTTERSYKKFYPKTASISQTFPSRTKKQVFRKS